MPRRRARKRSKRLGDQGDWNICISWQRMYVALQNMGLDEASLRLPITVFLSDSRALVVDCPPKTRDRALALWRRAWEALSEMETWEAAVRCMEARAYAKENPTIGQQQIEGMALCEAIREVYKTAPSGFEKVGRSVRQDE